jgi:hypothetical protein
MTFKDEDLLGLLRKGWGFHLVAGRSGVLLSPPALAAGMCPIWVSTKRSVELLQQLHARQS